MGIGQHLAEIRRRLMLAIGGILLATVLGWLCYPIVFQHLQAPILAVAGGREGLVVLNFAGVASSFDMQIKVSIFAGILISSPWWIYQLWAFVLPGLTRRERRLALVYAGAGVPLFGTGVALAWYMIPQAVSLLTSFTPQGAANIIDAQLYLSFVMRVVLAFGIAFLLPLLMVALNAVNVVSAPTWRRGWRWAILLSAVFAAIATPTGDVISMIVLAIPICFLYFAAVGICYLLERKKGRKLAAQDPDSGVERREP